MGSNCSAKFVQNLNSLKLGETTIHQDCNEETVIHSKLGENIHLDCEKLDFSETPYSPKLQELGEHDICQDCKKLRFIKIGRNCYSGNL